MSIKLMMEHHLEFLHLKEGSTDSSESTHVKMPHCWKSYVKAQFPMEMVVAQFPMMVVVDSRFLTERIHIGFEFTCMNSQYL